MTAIARRLPFRGRIPHIGLTTGITAIIVKELRGRMRGRRAFIVLTIHVLLLAAFAAMFQRISEESISGFGSFGGQAQFASAMVGRTIFSGLLMLQTLMVAVLAPAATAGAISSEREHQTLELLTVTPISSLAIVLGKLLSALAWVFILVLASIPVTALVFVFGGVAPDDVVRGYIVLFATVIGLGSVGIFFSALTRRTGASTGLTFVVMLALVIGSLFLYIFLTSTAPMNANGLRKQPSEAILWLNPFVAQADVSCGAEDGLGGTCGFISGILGPSDVFINPTPDAPTKPGLGDPNAGGGILVPVQQGFGQPADLVGRPVANLRGGVNIGADGAELAADGLRDRFWPKSVISLLALAAILTTASVQFVSPTRRWRPSLPGPLRRLTGKRSAP